MYVRFWRTALPSSTITWIFIDMNILVTGANGQLGRCMRLVAESSADHYVFTDVVEAEGLETVRLDITSMDDVRAAVARYSADVIVNCAAYTNVEAAEDNYELAELLNARAPANLAAAMRDAGGLLVHISTDYVFGGESYNTPCREDMKGTPTGVYGLTKLHGEEAIKSSGCSYVIIRTAWLYSEFGKNFVKTMLALTSSRPSLQVVFDQVGTPTYARDLADAISVILSDYASACGSAFGSSPNSGSASSYSKSGIYHFSNEGVCSWYDFATAIAGLAAQVSAQRSIQSAAQVSAQSCIQHPIRSAAQYRCHITPCHSSEFPSRVTRPAFSVLDKTLIKSTFGISVPYWRDSLLSCLSNLLLTVES